MGFAAWGAGFSGIVGKASGFRLFKWSMGNFAQDHGVPNQAFAIVILAVVAAKEPSSCLSVGCTLINHCFRQFVPVMIEYCLVVLVTRKRCCYLQSDQNEAFSRRQARL